MKKLLVRPTLAALGLVALLGCGGAALAADAPAAPAAPAGQPGVWQQHKLTFQFMGFTTTYSCDGLADKLKELLIASGARKDAQSREGPCAGPFGHPDKFARADLTFYTLVPADEAKPKPGDEAGAGAWRPVELSVNRPHDLELGECELIEQFHSQVLPLFTTRNVEFHSTCVPHQLSGTGFQLTFEVFAAPPGARAPAKAPAPAAPAAPAGSGKPS